VTEATADTVGLLESPDSEGVVDLRLSLYGAAVDDPQRLGTFTDEELVGLDDLGRAPSAPSPWLTSLPQDEQDSAVTAALRGLTARGVYLATPVDAESGTFVYRAIPEILALLTMRRYTGCVVVAERQGSQARDWVVLYEQRAGLWLAEYVTHTGLHDFVLATAEATVESLTAWCGAPDGVPAPATDVVLTREQVAAQAPELEEVGRSTAAVTITRLGLGDTTTESWTGVFTGPEGSYVSVAEGDDGVRYRGAGRADVLAHWRDVLGAV
jgi:hypothetical protein